MELPIKKMEKLNAIIEFSLWRDTEKSRLEFRLNASRKADLKCTCDHEDIAREYFDKYMSIIMREYK